MSDYDDLIQQNAEGLWRVAGRTNRATIYEDDHTFLLETRLKDPLFNGVLRSNFSNESLEQSIQAIIARYHKNKLPFFWWFNTATAPTELKTYLQKYQLEFFGSFTGMAMELRAFSDINLPASCQFVDIDATQVTAWAQPIMQAFAFSDAARQGFQDIFIEMLSVSDNVKCLSIMKDGQVIASLNAFIDKDNQTVGLYKLTTLPEFRGQGIMTGLVKHTLNLAAALGVKTAVLYASPMSVNAFQAIGFKNCSSCELYLA